MQRLSRDEVISVVEPYSEQLYSIGAEPFAEYMEKYPNLAIHSTRTRANIIWDLMVNRVHREFRGVSSTKIIVTRNGVVLLIVAEKVCIRFKKLNMGGFPSNFPTPAAINWDRGEDLPGIPSAPQRLSLGYKLNRLQTAVVEVQITNVLNGRYVYGITLEAPSEGLIVLDSRDSATSTEATPKRRVFIRPSEEQSEM